MEDYKRKSILPHLQHLILQDEVKKKLVKGYEPPVSWDFTISRNFQHFPAFFKLVIVKWFGREFVVLFSQKPYFCLPHTKYWNVALHTHSRHYIVNRSGACKGHVRGSQVNKFEQFQGGWGQGWGSTCE